MKPDRVWYLVEGDGPVSDVIIERTQIWEKFMAAAMEFKRKHQALAVVENDGAVVGLRFAGTPPAYWRTQRGPVEYSVPLYRQRGIEIAKEMDFLPRGISTRWLGDKLGKVLGGDWFHWGDSPVYFPTYTKIAGCDLISIPIGLQGKELPGCRRLKMSEFWQLVEKENGE